VAGEIDDIGQIVEPVEGPQQAGFPPAGWPEDYRDGPIWNNQVDFFEGFGSVRVGQI
jgi:hypothetical protein